MEQPPQIVIVVEHTVMGQCKLPVLNAAAKRVIIFIFFGSALRLFDRLPAVTYPPQKFWFYKGSPWLASKKDK